MLSISCTNEVTIQFLSRSSNEGFARNAVASFVAQLDPTLDEIGDIKTAVSEAVTNAIVHAYPEDIGKIMLRIRLYSDRSIEIYVKDWGIGIDDIEKAKTAMFTTGNDERSGMGFTIMDSFMDKLKVVSKRGKGTVITMRRRFSPRLGTTL